VPRRTRRARPPGCAWARRSMPAARPLRSRSRAQAPAGQLLEPLDACLVAVRDRDKRAERRPGDRVRIPGTHRPAAVTARIRALAPANLQQLAGRVQLLHGFHPVSLPPAPVHPRSKACGLSQGLDEVPIPYPPAMQSEPQAHRARLWVTGDLVPPQPSANDRQRRLARPGFTGSECDQDGPRVPRSKPSRGLRKGRGAVRASPNGQLSCLQRRRRLRQPVQRRHERPRARGRARCRSSVRPSGTA
jgi:hypothetical protein